MLPRGNGRGWLTQGVLGWDRLGVWGRCWILPNLTSCSTLASASQESGLFCTSQIPIKIRPVAGVVKFFFKDFVGKLYTGSEVSLVKVEEVLVSCYDKLVMVGQVFQVFHIQVQDGVLEGIILPVDPMVSWGSRFV